MFRVRASKALEAINDANRLPLLRIRNLHSLFDDINHAHNDQIMSNNTTDFTSEDHYHRPAAGGFSSSTMISSDPTNQEEEVAAQADNSIDALSSTDNNNQTLSFTLIFLSLMIVYIGFCFHYRKVKIRRSVGDEDTSTHLHQNNNNTNRNRQRRNNQAVLDESSSRANRAAADIEEQRKLEERKQRIGEVLWSRLIVEDDEENDEEEENDVVVKKVDYRLENKGGRKDEGISVNAASDFENSGEDDEENQVMNDRDHGQEENYDEEMGMKAAAVEEKTLAQDENVAAAAGTLATTSSEEATVATVPNSSSEETTIATMPSNSNEVMSTIGASPSSSTFMVAVVSPPPSPPSSPFRKYADALSCNSCHHHATNYCNNNNIICNSSDATTHNNNNDGPGNKSSSSLTTTITLSNIQQTYGEECNICLSNFQVGDRAAWSKHHFNGCTHVFHDECMKRWLLVRDGCPICRRSYLSGVVEKKIPEEQVIDGVEDEGERDLESGGGGGSIANATIIPEE